MERVSERRSMRRRRRVAGLLTLALVGVGALTSCRAKPVDTTIPGGRVPRKGGGGAIPAMERPKAAIGEATPAIAILEGEIARNLAALRGPELEEAAYFLAYDLVAREQLWLEAESGRVVRSRIDADRTVDIDVRVGSPELDNGHTQGGNYGPGNGLGAGLPVSVGDDPLALAQALWVLTESQYRDAVDALRAAENTEQLRSQDDGKAHPDFSKETPLVHVEPPQHLDLAALEAEWEPKIREVSAILGDDPLVFESNVVFLITVDNRSFVNSEGTKVQGSQSRLRVMLNASTQAEDGMNLERFESFEVHTPEQLPSLAELSDTAARLRRELLELRQAPLAEPYIGPAVLSGRAAGVFFHEVFGHRLEGHRQKDDMEGQTFADMLGQRVLPAFLDMIDDPTVAILDGQPLSGHYYVDDEGVKAQKVNLVEKGKLKGFLLGRSPVLPFKKSNGHGRRERGNQVVARQGNLIVTSRKTIPEGKLRAELIAEVKRQGKPYGLWFTDIQGGYTITDRSGPQAFKVLPLMVYRVWADGRPDELVRGADIVGTPIAAFETIIATGDEPGIFNGMCGAESGDVPVSAVSPSLLLRALEIERASHDRDKPPLLPAPPAEVSAGAKGKSIRSAGGGR
ncbi:MAG: peptidase U62 [Myxococcales bacterium]|nr:peptidase U62 [Myxococcales bacterium]